MYNPVAGDVCKFEVVSGDHWPGLVASVNHWLSLGWQLHGTVLNTPEPTMTKTGTQYRMHQPMTLPWRDYK